jgi:hypothetical protein
VGGRRREGGFNKKRATSHSWKAESRDEEHMKTCHSQSAERDVTVPSRPSTRTITTKMSAESSRREARNEGNDSRDIQLWAESLSFVFGKLYQTEFAC